MSLNKRIEQFLLKNGEKVVLPPEEAAEAFAKLPPAHKLLYTEEGLEGF